MKSIGSYAFSFCNSLVFIYSFAILPPSISNILYYDSDYDAVTLYVPAGCKEAYQGAEGWEKFTHIVEYDVTGIQEPQSEGVTELSRYTTGGELIAAPQKGVNILRMSDGSTRKVYVK